jgi:arylsulfatase A-like enzyme
MRLILAATVFNIVGFAAGVASASAARPNIVHILADDLGFGSVGFNGQTRIRTPHLDRLAAAGMRFTAAYASPLCSPSRAMLMTGFHNGHTFNDRNTNFDNGFRSADVTVAETLRQANYSTAIFGKWGFGGSEGDAGDLHANPTIVDPQALPNNQGFREFFGELNHFRAHSYFVDSLWQTDASGPHGLRLSRTGNSATAPTAAFSHDLIAARSLQYVQDRARDIEPFYMQVNLTIPHYDLDAIAAVPHGLGSYSSQPWTDKEKKYAAMISRLDASIGALIAKLDDPNGDGNRADSVAAKTLVVFTSDNGPTAEDGTPMEFFRAAGKFRGGKRDLFEGGVRVPMLAYWPGTIAAGAIANEPVDLADFLPTAAELAGTRGPVGMDGVSLVPTLTQQGIQRRRDYLVFEHHEANGPDPDTRDARWSILRNGIKLIEFGNGEQVMYNIASDPTESSPLDLRLPANRALRDDLRATAWGEGVQQPDDYAVEYREWTGADGDHLENAEKWSHAGTPAGNWSAVINNTRVSRSIVHVQSGITTLGLEVSGPCALQTLRVGDSRQVEGRNEIRIGDRGRIHLDQGQLTTNRWVDVLFGGQLTGQGTVSGHVYNAGRVAPGLPKDLPAPPAGPRNVNTRVILALNFDFREIQDDAPLVQTSAESAYLHLVHGFDFGPGTLPRGFADSGSEFNVQGFTVGGTLADAIAHADYLTFSVAPVAGLSMTLDAVSLKLWRNGSNAARHYAVLSSINGFTETAALGTWTINDAGPAAQHWIHTTGGSRRTATGPVEIRVYGWGAGQESGNTHVTAVSLSAGFVSLPAAEIRPTGTLTIDGNYTHLADATLAVDLSGHQPGIDWDRLQVNGRAHLDGGLHVSLISDGQEPFLPHSGDQFEILTATEGITGRFSPSRIVLPTLPSGIQWDISYDENSVLLNVVRNQQDLNDTPGFRTRDEFGRAYPISAVPEPASTARILWVLAGLYVQSLRRKPLSARHRISESFSQGHPRLAAVPCALPSAATRYCPVFAGLTRPR